MAAVRQGSATLTLNGQVKNQKLKWRQKKQKLKKVIVVTTHFYSCVMFVVEIILSL